ncbi:carbohydrate ABC transporter permease [Paenibacillus nasutitermitis]|uniref:Binding-protein-dependent transport systems inner membrane component n=1 Tax=Paenibacillus nasutitermitis TaxID=1652958 RepID=A0A916YNL3_9BACL|nr:sugar ABC transporter permease [Paenibacillus nasutitermitis]GGD53324.1 binding-protein-dependent transport systems inner membrane component [Paenibacillus nasutitermitis]
MTAKRKRTLFIASFILPTFILYCIFTVYPIFKALQISLFDWSGSSENMDYIGLGNFREMFSDPIIYKAIVNDYFLIFWKIVGIMLLATLFAVALTRFRMKGEKFFRAVFFFPNVLSIVVIAVLWRFIYNPSFGLLNNILSIILNRKVEIPWLGDTQYSLWALLPPAIWAGIGFFMILLIAAIKSIPLSLYESAEIDGAKQWKQFKHITLPLIWEQIKVSIVLIVITSLNGSFAIVSVMTEGGPDNSTQVLGYYLYQMGFKQFHMGYASAVGVLILVLSLLTTVILQKLLKKETYEVS